MMKKNAQKNKNTTSKNTQASLHKKIDAHFKRLEDTLLTLQQEFQETLFHMEMRLENLELIIAEIQVELSQKQKDRMTNVHPQHH